MTPRPISLLVAPLVVCGCAVVLAPEEIDRRDDITVDRPTDCTRFSEGVEVIVSGASPGDVVLLEDFAYWLNGAEEVLRSAIGTEDATISAAGGRNLAYAAAAGELVCWAEYVEGGGVYCLSTREDGTFVVAAGEPSPLAVYVSDDAVFWTAGGTIKRAPITMSPTGPAAGESTLLFAGPEDIVDIAVHDGFVYWAGSSSHGGVSRAPATGGEREVVSEDLGDPGNIAVDDDFVYAQSSGGIMRIAFGGDHELLVGSSVSSFTIDASHVYWTSPAESAVKRISKLGGEEEILADGTSLPYRIAVNDCVVVWSDLAAGSIVRVLK